MSATLNDQVRRAILEYLYELSRIRNGTHGHETVGDGVYAGVRKRIDTSLDDFASNLSCLVETHLVRERRLLRIRSNGKSVEYVVYSIAALGLVEIEGKSKIRAVKGRPIEALPKARELRETYFNHVDIHLLDFIPHGLRVIGQTFEDCLISGPAVIDLVCSHLDDECVFFVAENDDATVTIPTKRTLTGALPVEDCIFRSCRFRNVGVLARAELVHVSSKLGS